MSGFDPISGGCLCGGVRYVLKAAPGNVGDCHCIDCRRAAGAQYVTWGSVRRADLRWMQGEVGQVHFAGRTRSFARCCGTPLCFGDEPDEEEFDLTIASLDDPAPFAPKFAIWLEDRLPWVALQPGKTAYVRNHAYGEIYQP